MNLTPAEKARLGAFILASSTVLFIGVTVLAGLRVWDRRHHYIVRFEDSISGLEPNAQVRYRGLRVGRVEKLQVDDQDPTMIKVTLAVDPALVLYEGTQALLQSSGLTGLKTIDIAPGDPRSKPLPPGSELEAGVAAMDRVLENVAQVAHKLERVVSQLATWTNDANRERVEKLLDSLNLFVSTTDAFLQKVDTPFANALNSFSGLADEGKATLRAVRTPLERIEPNAVNDALLATKRAMSALDMRLSAAETGKALEELGESLSRLNLILQDLDLVVQAGREDFATSLRYLRQAAEDVREFSRIIAQDPSVLLRGREVGE